jgi:hypothetical protein
MLIDIHSSVILGLKIIFHVVNYFQKDQKEFFCFVVHIRKVKVTKYLCHGAHKNCTNIIGGNIPSQIDDS